MVQGLMPSTQHQFMPMRFVNCKLMVTLKEHPFAYVQDYPAHHWDAPQYANYPPNARALDTFLGDPDFLGQGHAQGYLKQRAFELHREYGTVLVDPDPKNTRAISCYEKAGFCARDITACEDGDPVLVMTFQP